MGFPTCCTFLAPPMRSSEQPASRPTFSVVRFGLSRADRSGTYAIQGERGRIKQKSKETRRKKRELRWTTKCKFKVAGRAHRRAWLVFLRSDCCSSAGSLSIGLPTGSLLLPSLPFTFSALIARGIFKTRIGFCSPILPSIHRDHLND